MVRADKSSQPIRPGSVWRVRRSSALCLFKSLPLPDDATSTSHHTEDVDAGQTIVVLGVYTPDELDDATISEVLVTETSSVGCSWSDFVSYVAEEIL